MIALASHWPCPNTLGKKEAERKAEEWEAKWKADVGAAEKWVHSYLAEGPKPRETLDEEGAKLGHTNHAIWQAWKNLWVQHDNVDGRFVYRLPTDEEKAAADVAEKWMLGYLADGPKPRKTFDKECDKMGFTYQARGRAQDNLGVEEVRLDGKYVRRLPQVENDRQRSVPRK